MQPAFACPAFPASRLKTTPSISPQTLRISSRPRWRAEIAPHTGQTNRATDQIPAATITYKLEVVQSVTDIDAVIWDKFATSGCNSPFLSHHWLRCLEQSQCASIQSGWLPQHIVMRSETEIVLIAPAYVKTNSLGEFVFDQEWAEAAYAANIMYYPKLLLAIPFTPASGRRIMTLVSGGQRHKLLRAFAKALLKLCRALNLSSVHVNFCREDEVEALSSVGFLQRKGVQYHFTNYKKGQSTISQFEKNIQQGDAAVTIDTFDRIDAVDRIPYQDFGDYLTEFKSKRRIKMRRERNVVRQEHGLQIEIVRGDDVDEQLMDTMFELYKSTIDKMFYGRQYLSRQFFELLLQSPTFVKHICLVLARRIEDNEIVAGTFNIISDSDGGAFYGRYWGCTQEYRYLHFETCYYSSIEYCINNGLSRMEPGAGGGDFKYIRGFEPAITTSMHYLQDERLAEAVARYLAAETDHIDVAVLQMRKQSAIRTKTRPENDA